jgi:hypothetical protein
MFLFKTVHTWGMALIDVRKGAAKGSQREAEAEGHV